MRIELMAAVLAVSSTFSASGQEGIVSPDMVQRGSDIPVKWNAPASPKDYDKREVMIPMRDGVKLHTVILVHHGVHDQPILLERTPYNASGMESDKPHMRDAVFEADREWVDDGYIIVVQDIRGKYGSEGDYVMSRPSIGPLNPTKTDDTTDAYDTVDWLVKNVAESNHKVGMIGSSYDGWTVTMALLGPHPALKVAAPESPMIDGWMGDDWFHYGAFRQFQLDYITKQSSVRGEGEDVPRDSRDDYQTFLDAGSAGAYAEAHGFKQLAWWNRMSAHPAYDAFWQLQALDKKVGQHPSDVPTIWLQGLWDQEDMYGAIHSWVALKAAGHASNNHLVMGPWYHSQVNGVARNLGPLEWNGDTATTFRRDVLIPFFNVYLKDKPPLHPLPPVLIYNPAEDRWDAFSDWPGTQTLTPLYLQGNAGLGFSKPVVEEDLYVSDPAKPVPFEPLPLRFSNFSKWSTWLVADQRFVSSRTDVLSYETPILDHPVTVEGAPVADLFAKTTGTDGDFVVKVIDVYPATDPVNSEMGGYQLPVSLDIFRGRYRKGFAQASPIPAGQVQEYKFALPTMNYVFKPGHRIMVQVQSSLFPLYDRNPQTYVANIFLAKPADYKKATVSLEIGGSKASAVLLPVVPNSTALKP